MLSQQGLFEEEDDQVIMSGAQTGFFSFPPNMTLLPSSIPSLKTLATISPSLAVDTPSNPATGILFSSATSKQRDDVITSHHFGLPQLSLQRSTSNLWAWGEVTGCCMSSNKRSSTERDDHLGVSAGMKMKKIIKGRRRKVREPRFCFKTLSDVDVLDDGYKWRKYGQKVVKNTLHPRSYYRCTQDNCRVKKRVERLAEDPRMVITTYEGRHAHSPSHDEDDSRLPPNSSLFW